MVGPVVVAQRYSKKQVNRAGKLLAALFQALRSGEDNPIADSDINEISRAIDVIDWWRSLHAGPLARVNAGLRYYLAEIHDEPPTQRLKKFSTIINKLEREPRMQLTTMQDIGGVRAILPDQRGVEAVVARLQRNWGDARPGRSCIHKVRDYVRKPKADGYRAVHVIVRSREGFFVEIQLRTPWQDSWAQSVEFDTRELDVGLKFGLGPSDLHEYYAMVSELVAMREAHVEPPEGFLEQLRELQRLRSKYYAEHKHG
jgi:hypothetical protein